MLLLAHLAVTCFLTGLIWLVQGVHYPLFARVGSGSFAAYHAAHGTRITWVVGPAMLLELALAGLLLLERPNALTWAGAVLVGVIWASTAFVQVPLHTRLSSGPDPAAIRALVVGNWIRTLAWSARAGIAFALVLPMLAKAAP